MTPVPRYDDDDTRCEHFVLSDHMQTVHVIESLERIHSVDGYSCEFIHYTLQCDISGATKLEPTIHICIAIVHMKSVSDYDFWFMLECHLLLHNLMCLTQFFVLLLLYIF